MNVSAVTFRPVDSDWVKEAIAAYVRAYVRRRVEAGESKRAIGLSLGFKGGHRINQYVDPKKYGPTGVSAETQARVAELLHGGSLDALRLAAINFARERPEEMEVPSTLLHITEEVWREEARRRGHDPDDPTVAAAFQAAYKGLEQAAGDQAERMLQHLRAAEKGKTLGVREVTEDEDGLPRPRGRGRKG